LSFFEKVESLEANDTLLITEKFIGGGSVAGFVAAAFSNLPHIAVAAAAVANLILSKYVCYWIPPTCVEAKVVIHTVVSGLIAAVSAIGIMTLFGSPPSLPIFLAVTTLLAIPSISFHLIKVGVAYYQHAKEEAQIEADPNRNVIKFNAQEWGDKFQKINQRLIDEKSFSLLEERNSALADIYDKTAASLHRGYQVGDKKISPEDLNIDSMRDGLVVSVPKKLSKRGINNKRCVSLLPFDTLEAAKILVDKEGDNAVVLNEAHAYLPGGCVVRGGVGGIEEELFRRTTLCGALMPSLNRSIKQKMVQALKDSGELMEPHDDSDKGKGKEKVDQESWDKRRRCFNCMGYLIPKKGCIYTPHVQVIRNKEYAFQEERLEIAVISAGVDALTKDEVNDREMYKNFLELKWRGILRMAAGKKHKNLVLSCFGSIEGKYDLSEVGSWFAGVLNHEEFDNCFDKIVFAMGVPKEDKKWTAWEKALKQWKDEGEKNKIEIMDL